MTENVGGTPRDPQQDPGTQPTQPLPESSLGAEPPAGSADPDRTESFERTESVEQSGATAPYGQPAVSTPYEQPADPGAYGQPAAPVPGPGQYGYASSPPKNDLAVWSLITGILSYVMCPILLGVAAVITGTMGRRAADEGLADNRGMATAGLILGWVNIALSVLGIVLFFILLGAGLLAGAFGEWSDVNDMNGYGY
ncbi:DUF4190 domain-containing protein [Promicromonospora sp. NPDC050249]|uniref:DUF4190 domain-containing protein n=1 Tax=Promicromonospora sp. NPDC050249 TaxID=3154743 RepID=UPI0033D7D947